MHDPEKQRCFVEYRSCGFSLRNISGIIDIPYTTLLKWNKKLEYEVCLRQQKQIDELMEDYCINRYQRLQFIGQMYQKVTGTLEDRTFSNIKTPELFKLFVQLTSLVNDEMKLVEDKIIATEPDETEKNTETIKEDDKD